MPSLLLELFSEEIPARMQADAALHLQNALNKELLAAGYANPQIAVFSTPRRLVAMVDNLPLQQKDVSEEIKGPKANAPEAAIAGFLKKTGLSKEELVERNGVYFAVIEQKGKPTLEVLKPLIEEILAKFPWSKSMRWGSRDEVWVRPLHSILCILEGDVVPIEFAGLKASNLTYGHRFLAPNAIAIANASEYEAALEKANVIADREKRKSAIKASLEEQAASRGLSWQEDDKLLEEVVGLVEWPVLMFGRVNDEFMHLPPELLTTVMRSHQKYFTLLEPSPSGRGQGEGIGVKSPHPTLLPEGEGVFSSTFAFAANRDTKNQGKEIIAGNERVLRARFSDAKFFYEQDQKKPLAEWNEGLKKVTFHAKIGTVAEKVERIKKLSVDIFRLLTEHNTSEQALLEAASLCKADLTTGMVGEFQELQGIMGSYYAKTQGADDAVSEALYHLYDHPKDLKNLGSVAQILGIADRLDTLISLFAIGEKPTGSKDPYALRRAALGVIAIIRNHSMRLNLRDVIPANAGISGEREKIPAQGGDDELLEFFNDRLEADLLEQGIAQSTLRAIGGLLQDSDIVRVTARAKALQEFLASPESAAMLAAYRRAANILAIENKKDNANYSASMLDATKLVESKEKILHLMLQQLATAVEPLLTNEDYAAVMAKFATLQTPLDEFFASIMVNSEDVGLRKNRLSLLATIVETMNKIADFSKIS